MGVYTYLLKLFMNGNETSHSNSMKCTFMPRCLQRVASHFAPAGRIQPVVIVPTAVHALGMTLEPDGQNTSN